MRTDYSGELGVSVLCPGIVASSMWNTGAHRPAEFGGPIPHDPAAKAYMEEHGIRPEEAGRVAVEGVEAALSSFLPIRMPSIGRAPFPGSARGK